MAMVEHPKDHCIYYTIIPLARGSRTTYSLAIMTEFVPIIEHEMLASTTHPHQLRTALGRCLRMEIPGFKIPLRKDLSPGIAPDRHETIVAAIQRVLADTFLDLIPTTDRYGHDAAIGQRRVGLLHHDLSPHSDPTEEATAFNVNTILLGGGAVLLSSFGTEPERAKNSAHAHGQVRRGHVDSRIISPNIHTTPVSVGDTIVWPEGGCATAWHRFDTNPALGIRSGVLTVIHGTSNVPGDEAYSKPNFPVETGFRHFQD